MPQSLARPGGLRAWDAESREVRRTGRARVAICIDRIHAGNQRAHQSMNGL